MKIKQMGLKDTTTMMQSDDYKERLKAEYWQTKLRYESLKRLNTSIEAFHRTKNCELPFPETVHDCPDDILREQQSIMGQYLHILELRAMIENVDMDDFKFEEV